MKRSLPPWPGMNCGAAACDGMPEAALRAVGRSRLHAHVWIAEVEGSIHGREAWNAAAASLSASQLQRIGSLHPGRARLGASSHLLARHALAEWFADEPVPFKIVHDSNGRPSVVTRRGMEAPAISIARTEGYVAVALSEASPIGIDIEHLRHPADRMDHVLRTFDEEEQRMLGHACDRTEGIVAVWTMKEALGKALGKGVAYDQNIYRIRPTRRFLESVGKGRAETLVVEGWAIGLLTPRPDLRLAVAVADPLAPVSISIRQPGGSLAATLPGNVERASI